MGDVKSWRERAAAKRRKGAVERALRYLTEGLAGLPGVRKGTAEKRVRESAQPMSTAKGLVKDWRRRHPRLATKPRLEDDRAGLIRTAYAMELGHGWPAGDRADCICRESLALANRFYRETYLQP